MLSSGSPFKDFLFTLSESASLESGGWVASAFTTQVVYDAENFADVAAEEAWLRTLQTDLRDGFSIQPS